MCIVVCVGLTGGVEMVDRGIETTSYAGVAVERYETRSVQCVVSYVVGGPPSGVSSLSRSVVPRRIFFLEKRAQQWDCPLSEFFSGET
jgi:hypothetical protein